MYAAADTIAAETADFSEGIDHFGDPWPEFDAHGVQPILSPDCPAIPDASDENAVYQTLLAADALRYLTLQVTGAKASGHPGGFASSAEAHAALMMLGHTNIVTEVGHHAPGFYSAMFLDSSLEEMGISTVAQMREGFREREGLLGHLSGAIPGILSPAGPLGQGQHFAMAGATPVNETKIIALDDGPTGSQTVHSYLLLTRWDAATLRDALLDPAPLFFVLTNTRAMSAERAAALTREV